MIKVFKNKWITPPKEVHEDYTGRNIIVTGATSGIGKEAVFKFAKLGAAKVIMAARDRNKGESVKSALEARLGQKGQLEVWELDMMSYDSVEAFAKRAHELDYIDMAILNAGARRVAFIQSAYGWEEDMQVNTLSTTLLAILLLPKLKQSKQHTAKTPVLEFVNSGLHQKAVVAPEVRQKPSVLEHYNKKENHKEGSQYTFSKLFLMYAANKLADETCSGDVIVTSICPGWVNTDLGRDHFFPGVQILAFFFLLLFVRSPAQAANMILSGTTQGERVHGRFWQHDQIQPTPPSLQGAEMKEFGVRMWHEIVGALEKDVPEATKKIEAALHSCGRLVGWMPKSPFRRKPSAHGPESVLRFLFPRTRARARIHLSKFRHDTLPSLKHGAQSRIYRYLVHRQSLKLKGKPSLTQRLRGYTRRLTGTSYLQDAARVRRQQIVKRPGEQTSNERAMSYQDYEAREPGSRRRKLAGYLKAANELRQTYTQQYAPNWSSREAQYDYEDDTPGGFPDAAVVRSGREEMILFPSYARRHVKRKPEAQPGTIQELGGQGRDSRDSTGAGDAEFWKQQWNNYEDDNAVVDVDVRGWIYSPHKGQMSRKQRLFIGLARQLVGVQAPPTPTSSSADSSRDTSPQRHGFRERAHMRDAQQDEALAAREAEEILRRGEKEARAAARGAYSEKPAEQDNDIDLYRTESGNAVRPNNDRVHRLAHSTSKDSMRSEDSIKPLQKRGSWNQPSDMSPAELAEANARLMARLRHFLAIPMANTPISVFFYNETISKQRTVYTDAAGHFSMSAALDFVPTHVRILASDKLSATEQVIVTDSQGISVISDIDDTIKHSAIGSGAREIFRNVFIRDLVDLTIDGVREWYNNMAEMGVKFHYVSNSPWQLYPVISKYFSLAGLPPGSFHLKQYSGMLQGIFEPVAERKKVTLDKIARDFPERNFILIGDSGEADLEVYTDFVLDNPGRVVAVFIRDVTTSDSPGFFDPSTGPSSGSLSSSSPQRTGGGSSAASSKARALSEENDPELKAAIAASLRDMDTENKQRSKSIFPELERTQRPNLPDRKPSPQSAPKQNSAPNLIDLSSDDDVDDSPALKRFNSETRADNERNRSSVVSTASTKSAPPPPKKPVALRSPSSESTSFDTHSSTSKPPPPKPRQPSTSVKQSSPLVQQQNAPRNANTPAPPRPPVGPKPSMSYYQSQAQDDQQSYAGMARDKLWSVYSNLPALRSTEEPSSNASSLDVSGVRKAPPPPPPRRGNRDTASTAASYVGSKASSAWQHAPSIPYHTRPQVTSAQTAQPFSTAAPRQGINRTNTGSTLGGPAGEQYGTKKEVLWRQRWAHAEQVLGEQGVVLRGWRAGGDIMGEAERIIREAEKKYAKDEGKAGKEKKAVSFMVPEALLPSSKGKPTDPKLREKVKEEVKQETNKDGGGKGEWSAWKASKLSKEYEKKGGGYENEPGSKNEPKKGVPREKSKGRKKAEVKEEEERKKKKEEENDDGRDNGDKNGDESQQEKKQEEGEHDAAPASTQKPASKTKANTKAKQSASNSNASAKNETKDTVAKEKAAALKGKGKERAEGTRRSARVAASGGGGSSGEKRKTYEDDSSEDADSGDGENSKKRKKTEGGPKKKKKKTKT
ncbi:actin patch protein [Stemphylium lycopersici]|nr:actin patch protein [Stemphylium lycopersici]